MPELEAYLYSVYWPLENLTPLGKLSWFLTGGGAGHLGILNHNYEVPGPIEGKDEGELYVSVPYGSAELAGSFEKSANILRNGLYKIEPRSLVSGNTFEHAYVGSIGHLNRGTSNGAVTHVDVFTADHDSNEHTIRPASAYQFTPTSTHRHSMISSDFRQGVRMGAKSCLAWTWVHARHQRRVRAR